MRSFLIICLFVTCSAFGNTHSFTLKLDEFTLARSTSPITDTIEVTKKAWQTSDSLHVRAYLCGRNFMDMKSVFIARDAENLIIQAYYDNFGLGFRFSFPTSRIDPEKVKILAMTIGADQSEKKMGWKYRMGVLKFI